MEKKKMVSNVVIQRLPRYYRFLEDMREKGIEYVSSEYLAERMEVTASQIRHDMGYFGKLGKVGRGYEVEGLCSHLREILGITEEHHAIVIGMGYLAHAFLHNFQHTRSGFVLDAAFDTSEKRIGSTLMGVPVYSIDDVETYLAAHPQVEAALLMLPRRVVQEVVDRLVAVGIRGFWNFSNLELTVERENVYVENMHFADSLLVLGYHLSDMK